MNAIGRLAERLKEDYTFRTFFFAVFGCILSGLVSVHYGLLFIYSDSPWFGALSGYYFLLLFSRCYLLIFHRIYSKKGEERLRMRELKNYRACGVFLILILVTFSWIMALTVRGGFYREYVGLEIYVAAIYAFVKIVFAVINLVKAKGMRNRTVQSLRGINIADALVSVVALQGAMLRAFCTEGSTIDQRLFNGISGAVAGVLILLIGIYMLLEGKEKGVKKNK